MRSRLTRRAPTVAALVLVPLLLVATPAHADGTAQRPRTGQKSAEDRAAELYDKSADAYRRGDFKTAVDLLKEAYSLDPQPVLLYNLARAYEGLGDLDAAIDGYERFLAQNPKTEDRGAIEQRLVTLRRLRDERAAAKQREQSQKQQQQQQPTTPPPPPKPHHTIYPYVVGGVGAAGLVAGSVFGLMAISDRNDARTEPVQQRAIDLDSKAQTLATLSTVSFIVGGALVAAGVAWWVIEARSTTTGSTPVRVGVGVGPGYLGVGGSL